LVYGLYHERVFNHGNAEIKEIAGLLEKAFKIKIPNVYRTFSDVKNRKGGELKFIKSMANKIDVEINNNFK
jgi:hypothetical protein